MNSLGCPQESVSYESWPKSFAQSSYGTRASVSGSWACILLIASLVPNLESQNLSLQMQILLNLVTSPLHARLALYKRAIVLLGG